MSTFATNGSKAGPAALTAFDRAQKMSDNIKFRMQNDQRRITKMINKAAKTTKEEKKALKDWGLKPAALQAMSDDEQDAVLNHNAKPSNTGSKPMPIKKVIEKRRKLTEQEKEAIKEEKAKAKKKAQLDKATALAEEKAEYKKMSESEKKEYREQKKAEREQKKVEREQKKQEREAEKERKKEAREAKQIAKQAKTVNKLNEFLLVAPKTWEHRIHKERVLRLEGHRPCFWVHAEIENWNLIPNAMLPKTYDINVKGLTTGSGPCKRPALKESENCLCDMHTIEFNALPVGHPKRAWFVAMQEEPPKLPSGMDPEQKTMVATAAKVDPYWLADASDKIQELCEAEEKEQDSAARRLWKKRFQLAVRHLVPKIPCVWSQLAGKKHVCLQDCSPKSGVPLCDEHAKKCNVDSKCPEPGCTDYVTPVDSIHGSEDFCLHHAHLKFYCHFEVSTHHSKPTLCPLRAVTDSIHYCVQHATEMHRRNTYVDRCNQVLHLATTKQSLESIKIVPLFPEPEPQPIPLVTPVPVEQRAAFLAAKAERERIKQEAQTHMEVDEGDTMASAYQDLYSSMANLMQSVNKTEVQDTTAAPMEGVVKTAPALPVVSEDVRMAFAPYEGELAIE